MRARVRGLFAFSLEQRDTGELLFSAWIATHPLPRIERSGIVRRPNTNLCRAKTSLVFDDWKNRGTTILK